MLQQNQMLLGQTHSTSTMMPYTFTTNELDSLRGKLQTAEHQMAEQQQTMPSSSSKNIQSIIQLSLNEIRSLQKMIDMTYFQGLSGSGMLPSIHVDSNSMGKRNTGDGGGRGRGGNNTGRPPSNYVCHKCNIPGHYVHDCPNVTKAPPPENYLCYKCNVPGHWIQECPLGNQQDYTKSPPPGYCCHRCGISGHWIKNCPTNENTENTQNNQSNNFNNIQNNHNDQNTSTTYGLRDSHITQQQSNTEQNNNSKNEEYLDKDGKDPRINVTQGGIYNKKKRHLDEI